MNRDAVVNAGPAACRVLEWDSEFFGFRIARVDGPSLDDALLDAADRWCATAGVRCAYLLVDAGAQQAIEAAETHGYRLADVRVTLARDLAGPQSGPAADGVRPARVDDIPRLRAIAGESHRDTRFHVDRRFDPRRADELYEIWIEKSCRGWADAVIVADGDGGPVGYVTCHVRGDEGQIGLVGVAAGSRGKGIGRALIEAAYRWFRDRGVTAVSVATQGRNAGGLQLYQHTGMRVRALQLWFHKWFETCR